MYKNFDSQEKNFIPPHLKAAELDVFKRSVSRSGMSSESFVTALTRTSLSSLSIWGQADLELLLLAAEKYGVNPIGREIFLIHGEGRHDEAPVVVLGVDGWSHLLNSHKKFAGMQFAESDHLIEGIPSWIECSLHRWDRCVPTTVREYFEEVRGSTQPWITHPRRMLRHKALVQCARLAFGLVGVYDLDEAQRICNGRVQSDDQSSTKRPETNSISGLGVTAVKRHLGLRAV